MTLNSGAEQSSSSGGTGAGRHRAAAERVRAEQKRNMRRGATSSRLGRTVVLGCLVAAFGMIWLAQELGMDRDDLWEFLGTSALFVVLFLSAGALVGGVVFGARALSTRRAEKGTRRAEKGTHQAQED